MPNTKCSLRKFKKMLINFIREKEKEQGMDNRVAGSLFR